MRPYRKERVASIVRDVVSEAIAHRMNDPRLAPFTTVTRVEMTGDLQIAKVFLSVQGGEVAERKTTAAMRHAAGFIQRLVASQLSIRHCPELRFAIDEVAKNVRRTMELLADNRRQHPELFDTEDLEDGDRGVDGAERPTEARDGSPETAEGIEE
jgi:ribosome-binding factor A